MKLSVYILCDVIERELPEVKEFCKFLDENNCAYYFSFSYTSNEHSTRSLITEVDAFVAIIGATCDCGSAYHDELWLAFRCYQQNHGKPNLYGITIGDYKMPPCSQHILPYITFLPDKVSSYEAIFNK